MPERKIVQLIVTPEEVTQWGAETTRWHRTEYILCDDGTAWRRWDNGKAWSEWVQILPPNG